MTTSWADGQVVIVIFVIIVGAFKVDVSNWTPFAPNGFRAVLTGATVVFFAYVGFDAVANSAEESKRPQVSRRIINGFPCYTSVQCIRHHVYEEDSCFECLLVFNFNFFCLQCEISAGLTIMHNRKPSYLYCIIHCYFLSDYWNGTLHISWRRCSFGRSFHI